MSLAMDEFKRMGGPCARCAGKESTATIGDKRGLRQPWRDAVPLCRTQQQRTDAIRVDALATLASASPTRFAVCRPQARKNSAAPWENPNGARTGL
jgi:hypothetical protein